MKVANIMPIAFLKKFGTFTKYHLVLTHLLLSSPAYKEFFTNLSSEHFIMLDNSVVELGTPMDFNLQLVLAVQIGANEIVLPDYINDKVKTIHAVNKTLKGIPESIKKEFSFMAVIQGHNFTELIKCYEEFSKNPEINTIGIPYAINKLSKNKYERIRLVNYLIDSHKWNLNKPHHLLGMDNLDEVKHQKAVRGVDSRYAVIQALDGKSIFEEREKEVFSFDLNLDEKMINPIRLNIGDLNNELR